MAGSKDKETIARNGVPLLPPRKGERPVSPEDVEQMLDDPNGDSVTVAEPCHPRTLGGEPDRT